MSTLPGSGGGANSIGTRMAACSSGIRGEMVRWGGGVLFRLTVFPVCALTPKVCLQQEVFLCVTQTYNCIEVSSEILKCHVLSLLVLAATELARGQRYYRVVSVFAAADLDAAKVIPV